MPDGLHDSFALFRCGVVCRVQNERPDHGRVILFSAIAQIPIGDAHVTNERVSLICLGHLSGFQDGGLNG